MTTNKPEVVAYHHSNKTNPDIRGVSLFHDPNRISKYEITEPLIRLSDYEALQAENERLRKYAERYRWLRSVPSGPEAQRIVNNTPEGMDAAIDVAMEKENKQ